MAQLNVYFKKMDSSEALENLVREKVLGEVHKFLSEPIKVDLTFEVGPEGHTAHCHVHKGNQYDETFVVATDDMYTTVDALAGKIHRSLARNNEQKKTINHYEARELNAANA